MELIADANVLISALITADGKTFDLIFNNRIKLFSPEFLLEEFEEHKGEILSKSKYYPNPNYLCLILNYFYLWFHPKLNSFHVLNLKDLFLKLKR